MPLLSAPSLIINNHQKPRSNKAFGFTYDVRKPDIDEKAIRHGAPRALVLALAHAKADALLAQLRAEAADALTATAATASTSGHNHNSSSGNSSNDATTLLITCDQVVVHEDAILEKPADAAECRRFIAGYARSPASTVGSVVCTRLRRRRGGSSSSAAAPGDSSGGAAGGSGGEFEAEAADGGEVELEEQLRAAAVERCTILMDPLPAASVDALIEEGEVLWCAGGLMVEHALVRPHVRGIEGGGEDSVMGLGREAVMRVIVEAAEAR